MVDVETRKACNKASSVDVRQARGSQVDMRC